MASPNSYRHPNHTIGPSPEERSLEGWREALLRGGWGARLEALVWLGGDHASGDEHERVLHESREDAELVRALRGDADVRKEADHLAHSADAWTREAAAAVQACLK